MHQDCIKSTNNICIGCRNLCSKLVLKMEFRMKNKQKYWPNSIEHVLSLIQAGLWGQIWPIRQTEKGTARSVVLNQLGKNHNKVEL